MKATSQKPLITLMLLLEIGLGMGAVQTHAQGCYFGNSPTTGGETSIATTPGDTTIGQSIGFTPLESLNFTNATLWLSNYTGANEQTISLSLFSSTGLDVALSSPAPNSGSLAAFTFSDPNGSVQLQANVEYWLVATESSPIVSQLYPSGIYSYVQSGGSFTGNATFNGDDEWSGGWSASDPQYSTFTPAFAVNAVPEPSELALGAAGSLALLFLRRNKQK